MPTDPDASVRAAATLLLDALKQARTIRRAALERYRDSRVDPLAAAAAKTDRICADALSAVRELNELLEAQISRRL